MNKKISLISIAFTMMLLSFPTYGVKSNCYIDTQDTDLWAFIGEAAEHSDKLLMINNIEDRKVVSSIFKKLVNKKGEIEIKIKEGDNLVKRYEELKNIYEEEDKLERKIKEQYDQLSYAAITQLRSEIQIKHDKMVDIYEKDKFRKLSDVTAELKIIVTDMAILQKELLNIIEEINKKQQSMLLKNPLFKKIEEVGCME